LLPNELLQEKQDRPRSVEFRGIDLLMAKLLTLTIEGYLKNDYWMKEDVAERNGHGIFSFSELCSYFNLNEAKVRTKIAKLSLKKWHKIRRRFSAKALRARGKRA